jgi:Na+-transporting methylmalonyl-CoA/oxaloacetate decarboxylase gamma subunit
MRKVLLTFVAIAGAALVNQAAAQGINNIRINEVLVHNEDNYMDDYGHRSSWIEIFNSGYEAVNVSSCYIGVTRTDGSETLYPIPSSDPATLMHNQTYLVFFCEGTDTKGTFFTNFTLEGVRKITFYSAGRNMIDEFELDPASQRPDVSVGYMSPDGISEPVVMSLPRTTPNATNETVATVPKDELFRQRDSSGGVMAIIAMSVVFIALVLIFFVLKAFGMAMIRMHERKALKAAAAIEAAAPPAAAKRKSAGAQVEEEMAAVALALKMYQEEQHILESTVITINRASRVYSPWSSKIHGIPAIPIKN